MQWGITLAVMVVTSVAVAVYIAWPLLVGRPEARLEGEAGEGEAVLDELLVQKDATYTAIKELEFDHAMGNLSKEDYRELARRYEDKAVALLKSIDQVSQGGPMVSAAAPAVVRVMLGESGATSQDGAIERQVAAIRRNRGKAGARGRAAGPARTAVEDEIEWEVARMRATWRPAASRNADPASEIERQVAALRANGIAGTAADRASAATPGLPARLSCRACGAPSKSASAAFCSRCGAPLATTCPVCDAPAEAGDAFCSSCGTSLAAPIGMGTAQATLGGANA